jgi:hypothetical protein
MDHPIKLLIIQQSNILIIQQSNILIIQQSNINSSNNLTF